jgi:cytochrome b561
MPIEGMLIRVLVKGGLILLCVLVLYLLMRAGIIHGPLDTILRRWSNKPAKFSSQLLYILLLVLGIAAWVAFDSR